MRKPNLVPSMQKKAMTYRLLTKQVRMLIACEKGYESKDGMFLQRGGNGGPIQKLYSRT